MKNDLKDRGAFWRSENNFFVRQLSQKDLIQFGKNIICLRVRAELTQEILAERAEISSRYYQSIESGNRWPSLGVLKRLKDALKCEWGDLFVNIE